MFLKKYCFFVFPSFTHSSILTFQMEGDGWQLCGFKLFFYTRTQASISDAYSKYKHQTLPSPWGPYVHLESFAMNECTWRCFRQEHSNGWSASWLVSWLVGWCEKTLDTFSFFVDKLFLKSKLYKIDWKLNLKASVQWCMDSFDIWAQNVL